MEMYDSNNVFSFGNNDTNVEQNSNTTNFNYNSISGLGESNYENEDLFADYNSNTQPSTEPVSSFNTSFSQPVSENYDYSLPQEADNDFFINSFDNSVQSSNDVVESLNVEPETQNSEIPSNDTMNVFDTMPDVSVEPQVVEQAVEPIVEEPTMMDSFNTMPDVSVEPQVMEQPSSMENFEMSTINMDNSIAKELDDYDDLEADAVVEEELPLEEPVENITQVELDQEITPEVIEEEPILEPVVVNSLEEPAVEDTTVEPVASKIEISDTPIEELNKLTEYQEDNIESTNINALFDKISVNVQDASDIFKRNTEMKKKIDSRFEDLKKLQSEIENAKKVQIEEINNYKDEVYAKLTDTKSEIEKRLNTLKELQSSLEKEKSEFEAYKKQEMENIEKTQKDVQAAYDERREELNHIEDVLRKQKDSLDSERSKLSLDKISYEADKNELANNLLKFNELVDSFTNGVNVIKEDQN